MNPATEIQSSDDQESRGFSNEQHDLDYEMESSIENEEEDEEASQIYDANSSDSDYVTKKKHKRSSKKREKSVTIKKFAPPKLSKFESSSDEEYFSSKTMKKAHYTQLNQKLKLNKGNDSMKIYDDSDENEQEEEDSYSSNADLIDTNPSIINETVEPTDCIDIVIKSRMGLINDKGYNSTIYAIKEPCNSNETEKEVQYLIKWVGWSHIHNTWESEQSIKEQNIGGKKKLENFIKKKKELEEWKAISNPEEIEFTVCRQQLYEELFEEYKLLERVIDHKSTGNDDSVEYFCKWQSLPYSECSWEDGNLIHRLFHDKIDEYKIRLSIIRRNDPVYTNQSKLRTKPHFVPFKTQPDFIGNIPDSSIVMDNPISKPTILRDYQLDGVNWLLHSWVRSNSVILADEMGLGKTIQTISFISCLYHHFGVSGPFLFILPLSTITAWQREFHLWSKTLNTIVHLGDSKSRQVLENHEWFYDVNRTILKFNVVLTTYEMILRDELLSSVTWVCLIVDEAHRLKNDESSLYKTLFNYQSFCRILITGTPLQNSLKELWSLLHFIMPDKFNSWFAFEQKFNKTECKDGYENLHNELEPYILRRIKKDVEKSLPPKIENILRVEMSQIQKRIYRLILTKNYKELSKGAKGNHANLLNIVVELKKCCNHASLIGDFDDINNSSGNLLQDLIRGSGKLILLDKLLIRLKENGNRVLIFSQMVKMLDILSTYMKLRGFYFQRLDGTVTGDIRRQALDHFNAPNSQDFCFLLSTKAGGLGINLSTADTVIIFDSDWNPQNDLQAQARAHRIGQKNKVKIYRLVTKGSVEEDIIERAKRKMVLDHLVIQRMDTTGRKVLSNDLSNPNSSQCNPFQKDELSAIVKFGAIDLFKDNDNESDTKLQEMDIDTILNMAETTEQTDQASIGGELLNSFRVANFGALEDVPTNDNCSWDQIIPENERLKLIEEERKQHQNILNLSMVPRRASTQNQHKKNKIENSNSQKDSDESSSLENFKKPSKSKSNNEMIGLSKEDVRKFVKSYKKFPNAWKRPLAVANDCSFNDKQMNSCKKLAELIHISCSKYQQSKNINRTNVKSTKANNKIKKSTSSIIKIAKVPINADSLYQSEQDLLPIAEMLQNAPSEDHTEWSKLTLPISIRSPSWTCQWTSKEDFMLILGVYLHGMGNWMQIKEDERLMLSRKVLTGQTPTPKHLQQRIDIIIKAWKRYNTFKTKKDTKKKTPVATNKSNKSSSKSKVGKNSPVSKAKNHVKGKKVAEKKPETTSSESESTDDTIEEQDSKTKTTAAANEMAIIPIKHVELTKDMFQKCKETFRPIKDTLKKLEDPSMIDGLINLCENNSHTKSKSLSSSSTSPSSDLNNLLNIKNIIMNIGMYIDNCKVIDVNNLWSFASQFTPLNAQLLSNLYFSFKYNTNTLMNTLVTHKP